MSTLPVILIGLGANVPTLRYGTPKKTLEAALKSFGRLGIQIKKQSRWYSSSAIPISDQPRYINSVVQVKTKLSPHDLLNVLLDIELQFGRKRSVPNAAREIDLDLLAYGGVIIEQSSLHIPHPLIAERAFVLMPICDINPEWRHPKTGKSAQEMVIDVTKDIDSSFCFVVS